MERWKEAEENKMKDLIYTQGIQQVTHNTTHRKKKRTGTHHLKVG